MHQLLYIQINFFSGLFIDGSKFDSFVTVATRAPTIVAGDHSFVVNSVVQAAPGRGARMRAGSLGTLRSNPTRFGTISGTGKTRSAVRGGRRSQSPGEALGNEDVLRPEVVHRRVP